MRINDNSLEDYIDFRKPKYKKRRTIDYRTKFKLFDKVGKWKVRFLKNVKSRRGSVVGDFVCVDCKETYQEVIKYVATSDDIFYARCSKCRFKNRFKDKE